MDFKPGQYIHLSIPPHYTRFSEFDIDKKFYTLWQKQGLFKSWANSEIYSKRNYSLASNPDNETKLRFNVRIALSPDVTKTSAGTGSSFVFNLKKGEEVELSGPFGDFLIKDTEREMVYLGGGAGMAPIRSHLSNLFETRLTKRKVSYWYGARSLNDLFYLDYFKEMEKSNPNFIFKYALSDPQKEDKWNGYAGFIHQYLFDDYLSKHPFPHEIEYYLCGPPAMIKASFKMLQMLDVPDEQISFDEF